MRRTYATHMIPPELKTEFRELMQEAVAADNLRAIAAAISPPISQRIEQLSLTPMLAEADELDATETANYQIPDDTVEAVWIEIGGTLERRLIEGTSFDVPTRTLAAYLSIKTQHLAHGNVGKMNDLMEAAVAGIVLARDTRTINALLLAGASSGISDTVATTATTAKVDSVIGQMEDLGSNITASIILCRSKRWTDIKAAAMELPNDFSAALRMKGAKGMFGDAVVVTTPLMPMNKMLFLPNMPVAKYPIRDKYSTQVANNVPALETGFVGYEDTGFAVTRNKRIGILTIT